MEIERDYRLTEVGVIPKDWEVMPFVHAVESYIDYRGRTPRKLGMSWGGGDILALSANNVQMGRIDPDKEAYYGSDELYRRWMVQGKCEQGDVLLTMEAPLGNVAQIPDSSRYILSQRVLLIKPKDWLLRDFLAHYMKGFHFQEQLARNSTGTTAKGIQRGRLDDLPIGLPPTKLEQQAIAEALSDAGAHLESLEQLVAKKRRLKEGASEELLTGKKRLAGFNEAWEFRALGEVAHPRTERLDPRPTGSNEFCIELEHIEQGTGRLIGYSVTSGSSSLKSVFQEDDVLFGKLRAYLRKYWLATREGVCSTEIWVLVADSSQLLPRFLFQLVSTDRFVRAASSTYGTHMPRSDWGVVKNYEVKLPGVAEQAAIATMLSDMDEEIAALKGELEKARRRNLGMEQELLTGRARLV